MSFPHGLRSKPLDLAEEAGEVAGMELALDLGSGPHALAPELDEARRRRLVEGVALAVGGEGELVELLRALSADDLGGAPVKLEAAAVGRPVLKEPSTEAGSSPESRGSRVHSKTSGGGSAQGSSRIPASTERPQRFSSVE